MLRKVLVLVCDECAAWSQPFIDQAAGVAYAIQRGWMCGRCVPGVQAHLCPRCAAGPERTDLLELFFDDPTGSLSRGGSPPPAAPG